MCWFVVENGQSACESCESLKYIHFWDIFVILKYDMWRLLREHIIVIAACVKPTLVGAACNSRGRKKRRRFIFFIQGRSQGQLHRTKESHNATYNKRRQHTQYNQNTSHINAHSNPYQYYHYHVFMTFIISRKTLKFGNSLCFNSIFIS